MNNEQQPLQNLRWREKVTIFPDTSDHMVGLVPSQMRAVPLAEAIKSRKRAPSDYDKVLSAKEIGICSGD